MGFRKGSDLQLSGFLRGPFVSSGYVDLGLDWPPSNDLRPRSISVLNAAVAQAEREFRAKEAAEDWDQHWDTWLRNIAENSDREGDINPSDAPPPFHAAVNYVATIFRAVGEVVGRLAESPDELLSFEQLLDAIQESLWSEIWSNRFSVQFFLYSPPSEEFAGFDSVLRRFLVFQLEPTRRVTVASALAIYEGRLVAMATTGGASEVEAVNSPVRRVSGRTVDKLSSVSAEKMAERASARQRFLAPFLTKRSLNALAEDWQIEYSSLHRWQAGQSNWLSRDNRVKLSENSKTPLDSIPV